MNISQLPYIISIASTGSLSAAARQLGVSQPALSKYLSELERQVGMDLFFRNKKQMVLTPAGKLYLKAAQEITGLYGRTRSSIAALDQPQMDTLRIGISPHRGALLFSDIYPDFHRRCPGVQLVPYEGYAAPLKEKLCQGELDFIFTSHLGPSPEGLRAIRLLQEEVVVAMPEFHHLVHHSASELADLPYIKLEELQNSVFVMPTPSSALYDSIHPYFVQRQFSPQVSIATPNVIMEIALIRSGSGIGMLPAYYVQPDSGMAFFRLPGAPVMPVAFLFPAGHVLSETERYVVYLILMNQIHVQNHDLLWNDELRRIVWEFDPVEAMNLHLEAAT